MVILAGRSLLYGPLKFNAVFVAKMFRDLSPRVFNFYAKFMSQKSKRKNSICDLQYGPRIRLVTCVYCLVFFLL